MANEAIIIGGGHNGLVCANYLAAAGMNVRVLERRGIVGGAAVTEEFHPGFKNSVASYTVSLLNPKVIKDLDEFKKLSDLIVANRMSDDLRDVKNKLYTRDLFFNQIFLSGASLFY